MAQRAQAEAETNRAEAMHALESIRARGSQLMQNERATLQAHDATVRRSANEELELYRRTSWNTFSVAIQTASGAWRPSSATNTKVRMRRVCGTQSCTRVNRSNTSLPRCAPMSRNELVSVEMRAASQHALSERELWRVRVSETSSAQLSRMEFASLRARTSTDSEVVLSRCQRTEKVALDNARMHAAHQHAVIEGEYHAEQGELRAARGHLADEDQLVTDLRATAMGMQGQVDDFVTRFTGASQLTMEIEQHQFANAEVVAEHEENAVAQLRLEVQRLQNLVPRSAHVSPPRPPVAELQPPPAAVPPRTPECAAGASAPATTTAAAVPPPPAAPLGLRALRTKPSAEPFRVTSLVLNSEAEQQR